MLHSFSSYGLALPEIILFIGILFLTSIGVFFKNREKASLLCLYITLFILMVSAASLFFLPNFRDVGFNGHFFNDYFTFFSKTLTIIPPILLLITLSRHLSFFNLQYFEFSLLLLFATLGLFILMSSNDFLTLYMGIELQSLALYLLIALQNKESYEGVLKYFVLGAIASAFLLLGISFIYGYTGSTNFFTLEDALTKLLHNHHHPTVSFFAEHALGLLVGFVFFLAGLFFKLSAVPFHMWTPDVYESSPYAFLMFLATAPKIAILSLMMRLLSGPFFTLSPLWSSLFLLIALSSMVIGTFFALTQENLKRFLAYTSISSIGFSLLGIAMGSEIGMRSSLFYTIISMLSLIGLLSCFVLLKRHGKILKNFDDLKGLASERPLLSLSIATFILTLSGIPPFPGFFGKLYLLEALIAQESYRTACAMVLTTVVAAYYFLRFLKLMFFDVHNTLLSSPSYTETKSIASSRTFSLHHHLALNYVIVFTSIVAVTGLIFLPKYLFKWISVATSVLFYG